ncbi:Conserved hypothetical protein [gamma proteobacterium HdN1]|nr:Conserved hypothetical protein [gamma proteobacterium HdN1]
MSLPPPDAYTENLAVVNETNSVLASEDIVNAQGILVAKKGTPINKRIAAKLMTFKLTKPLESSVSVDNEINGNTLLLNLRDFLRKNEELQQLHDRVNLEAILPSLASAIDRYPVIRQKLTVMSIILKEQYQQCLFSAWLASVIGLRMRYSREQVQTLFLAGITHDLGMVHISAELLNKKEQLTPEEWRQIQAHPIISQKILAAIENLPKEVVTAALEHHERADGSGYPAGRHGNELSPFGQVIGMTDTFQGAWRGQARNGSVSLRNLIPVLQMNAETHFYHTYETLVTLLRQSGLGDNTHITHGTLSAQIQRFNALKEPLTCDISKLSRITTVFPNDHKERELHAISAALRRCLNSVAGSGILDEGYARWLQQVEKEKLVFAYRELEDALLMLNELKFQVSHILRSVQAYVEFGKNRKLASTIAGELKSFALAS